MAEISDGMKWQSQQKQFALSKDTTCINKYGCLVQKNKERQSGINTSAM